MEDGPDPVLSWPSYITENRDNPEWYHSQFYENQAAVASVQNVTVKGNKNELIQGDYVLEVEGDMYTKIHKNQRIRVGARGEAKGGGGSWKNRIKLIKRTFQYILKLKESLKN